MPSLELRNKTQKTVFDGTEWVFIQNSSDPYLVQKISLTDLWGATAEVVDLRNKTQKTVFDGTEWVYIQNSSDPFLVQKISLSDLRGAVGDVVGSSIKTFSKLIPISPTFPWFCLSYPSVDFTTANYSTEFIDALRARKYIYDEFGTPVSSFSGAWASNVFTLDNNAANVAFITELAEDWLFHGCTVTNWRILSDGENEFNITGINVTSRTITVNLDSEATTGTSVELYTNRVYRDATKARHFSEAGLATYQAGGGKSGRLFRRDQMQRIIGSADFTCRFLSAYGALIRGGSSLRTVYTANDTNNSLHFDSANSSGARTSSTTDGETIAKSSSDYRYIYVGSYTA
jgi:hypothetical protein